MTGPERIMAALSLALVVVSAVLNWRAARTSDDAEDERFPVAAMSLIAAIYYTVAVVVTPPLAIGRAVVWVGMAVAWVRPAFLILRRNR